MSPEQILSEEIDHRSDIYSLGCIIFEMLCGAPPFSAPTTTALMMSHAQEPPPPFSERLESETLNDIPDGLENVVRLAMAKNPDDRPQDTEELRTQLEQALRAHQQGHAYDGPALPSSSGSLSAADDDGLPTPILIGAAAGLTLLIAIAAVLALLNTDEEDEQPSAEAMVADADTLEEEPDIVDPDDAIDDAPAPPEVSVRDTLQLRIDSEPAGAEILNDDTPLGHTPLNLTVESSTSPIEVELLQDDYHAKEAIIEPNPDESDPQAFSFELEPDRPAPRPASPPPSPSPSTDDDSDSGGVPSIQLLGDDDDDDDDDDGSADDGPNIPTL